MPLITEIFTQKRMSFPLSVKEDVLVACARHCCICHKFCGLKIELHHIEQESEGGDDTAENCIPVCFDCHGDMRSYDHKHPKGTKYTQAELKQHRDAWYARVAETPIARYTTQSADLDKATLLELKQLLPWERPIEFIKQQHFGGSFEKNELKPLYDFQSKCRDPSFEFLDAELEGLRASLVASIDKFLGAVAVSIFPLEKKDDWLSVPKDWEITVPDTYFKAIKTLNSCADQIGPAYDTLIKTARRKLGQ